MNWHKGTVGAYQRALYGVSDPAQRQIRVLRGHEAKRRRRS